MVDDAHSSGVLGRNGRGTVDHFHLHGRVDVQVGHAIESGGRAGRLCLRKPRPDRFSPSPGAAVSVLNIASAGRARRVPGGLRHHGAGAGAHRSSFGPTPASFRKGCGPTDFRPARSETPITPIMVGEAGDGPRIFPRAYLRKDCSPPASASPPSRKGKPACGPSSRRRIRARLLERAIEILTRVAKRMKIV